VVSADVALLTSGINGAVVLSVYSTALAPSGFLLGRTIDATAVLFTEPNVGIPRTSVSRQDPGSHSHNDHSCNRPIISFGEKITATTRFPLVKKVMGALEQVQERVAPIKMAIYDKLRISCLVPRMIRPFEPILKYARCKLGLEEDGFMEAARCGEMACQESVVKKQITHDLGPAPMKTTNVEVQTMADCFGEMQEVSYGARILGKIVNDQSCDDPRYQNMCNEAIDEGRIIEEERCSTPE